MKSKTSCGKISLAMPHELLSRLNETAKREGRSRSAQVRYTLNKALARPPAQEEKS
jgi:metal-responsive CopG/Arc/MetJ family transcriptional regulator